jgi:hypothetical protein
MTDKVDYYDILEIPDTSTEEEIKRQYKFLSIKYHPDKNNTEEATEIFQKIKKAYEVLSDSKKKLYYDKFARKKILANTKTIAPKIKEKEKINFVVSQEECLKNKIIVDFDYKTDCEVCSASGFKDRIKRLCKICNGSGKIKDNTLFGAFLMFKCKVCDGTGVNQDMLENYGCTICKGKTYVSEKKQRELELNGRTYIEDDDIIVTVVYHFSTTVQYTIYIDISLKDMVCGLKRKYDHPVGKKLFFFMKQGAIINPSKYYYVPNLGYFGEEMRVVFILHTEDEISKECFDTKLNFVNLGTTLSERYQPLDDDYSDCQIIYINKLETENIHNKTDSKAELTVNTTLNLLNSTISTIESSMFNKYK